jgi:SAM-dependent methyltransferase
MASWDDGYVTDIVYTSNFFRECSPTWLATASTLLGHRPPDLTKPFSYADLGCGHGFTALTIAATCPHADVWGFDFNPAHIESARLMAAQAGLTNVRFIETSFADLAAMADNALPAFDFIVSHGVLSWVSPENRAHLISVLGRRLRPGGLAYLSYNVTTGWSGMIPMRALMRMLSEASSDRTDLAVPAILDYVDRLKAGGAAAHPALESRLVEVRKQDARYIAHEFLNADWHPLMFADVAGEMQRAKCGYIGSATLSENIDAVSVPAGMVPLLNEAHDPILRETLRDFGSAQGFRRDLYRRGVQPMPLAEHTALVEDLSLCWSGQAAGDQVTIGTPLGPVTGRPEIYRPLLAMLENGPVSVRQMRATRTFEQRPLLELLQAVALLISGGYANPVTPGGGSPAARAASARLNQAIAAANVLGGDIPRLVTPVTGSAMNVDLLETLLVGELLAGRGDDLDALTTAVLGMLNQSGRSVQRDGQAVTNSGEARSIVTGVLAGMLEQRVPLLRAWGVLEG